MGSVDSTSSGITRYTSKPSGHSSHSSIATTSTAFSKKPSFASIRNAFKSGKNNDPPPVPAIDHHPYPVLTDPFNRSTSSLNTHVSSPVTSRGPFGSFTATSPPLARPPTPGSNTRTKLKNHTYAKSQHSHSGSFFHASDPGSDYGLSFSSSPPPVPRVPNGFVSFPSDTPSISDFDDDKVEMDLKTPTDYALHAVFIQFATSAETKIDRFLREPMVWHFLKTSL